MDKKQIVEGALDIINFKDLEENPIWKKYQNHIEVKDLLKEYRTAARAVRNRKAALAFDKGRLDRLSKSLQTTKDLRQDINLTIADIRKYRRKVVLGWLTILIAFVSSLVHYLND